MKRGIVPGLILLVALAASLSRTESGPVLPGREVRSPAERIVESPGLSSGTGRESKAPEAGALAMGSDVRTEAAPPKRAASQPSWVPIRSLIERELNLSPLQLQTVAQALLDREQEITACHDEIRKSGILDFQAYDRQAQRMKEDWYRRIDTFLDTEQHVRFVALVERGLLNEGLAFTIEPGMTVLE